IVIIIAKTIVWQSKFLIILKTNRNSSFCFHIFIVCVRFCDIFHEYFLNDGRKIKAINLPTLRFEEYSCSYFFAASGWNMHVCQSLVRSLSTWVKSMLFWKHFYKLGYGSFAVTVATKAIRT